VGDGERVAVSVSVVMNVDVAVAVSVGEGSGLNVQAADGVAVGVDGARNANPPHPIKNRVANARKRFFFNRLEWMIQFPENS
jgi:hypothetical protein